MLANAVELIDDDVSAVDTIYTKGGSRESLIINESGLYSLIFKSREAAAKRFKKGPRGQDTSRYGCRRPQGFDPRRSGLRLRSRA
ncbi:BRO-N domain-containing protein [Varunaivibrio sulfuroxidans]|uniref:BRO-N domain-containing protein n=1 Tax=Varunaivibrio sulfuroxidans TaxID=1773489 RepID=UPI001FB4C055|nr:BRO family protein [Varunaivibrio sulfuroxidans]WES32177.1 BRO family protein [Varunaivibrio sulfuroxidans]